MFKKLFVDHPRTVDETYGEHWFVANRFGLLMIVAGLGTMLHGFIPGMMTRTGSNMVRKLYGEMTRRQAKPAPHSLVPHAGTSESRTRNEWLLEYHI